MKIKDVMTREVRTIAPTSTIRDAAKLMLDIDAGSLPVADNERLVGMLTDRDIAVRAIAAGKGPDTSVGDTMSPDILYCFDDQDVDEVCENMSDKQVRRLPVVDRDKRLVGIVSLGDLAQRGESDAAGEALEGITRRGGERSQQIEGRA
jgi:CBS domain-containing protein